MRILILNSILYTSEKGIIPEVKTIKDTMIYNLAWAFQQLGHRVTLAAAKEYVAVITEEYPFEVVFFKSNFSKIFLPSVLPLHLSLFSFLRKNKNSFDLIITSEVFSFNSLFASILAPRQTVIWQELRQHNNKMKKIPSHIWYNIITLLMKNIFVIPRSDSAHKFIKQYMNCICDESVEHGVNIEKFMFSSEKHKQFIICSRLVKGKNLISIIENFKKFITKYNYKEYMLYFAGSGDMQQEIENFIAEENLTSNICLLGHLSHKKLNQYLSHSQALLINTLKDNNMVSIAESIASGTPIVTNTIPSNGPYIKQYKLGIVKDDWTADDLWQIVTDNKSYVSNCLTYRNKLDTQFVAQRIIDLYIQNKNIIK